MDTEPIDTDNPEAIEEIRTKFNEAVNTIWEVAEELGIEAETLNEAEAAIDERIDSEDL